MNPNLTARHAIAVAAQQCERARSQATAAARKIGTDQHHKSLGALYEGHAEEAQRCADRQAAWERLLQQGFFA